MHELFDVRLDNVRDWGDMIRVGKGGESERITAKDASFLAWLTNCSIKFYFV